MTMEEFQEKVLKKAEVETPVTEEIDGNDWYKELAYKMKSLDGQACDKTKHCVKEVNPHNKPGIYFGTPFVCEYREGACWQCVGHVHQENE